jgi:DNA replication protein
VVSDTSLETRSPSNRSSDRKGAAVERQVANRWTPRIAQVGWTPVSNYFLENYHRLNLTHSEAMVVVHLLSFKWDDAAPFPSLATLAKRMGITPPSVRTHLRNLEKKGCLMREIQVGTTNRFHLQGLFTKLETLMTRDGVAIGPKSSAESS